MQIPVIEVGIMSAQTVHFKLNGLFLQADTQAQWNECEGACVATGDHTFLLTLAGKQQTFFAPIILAPANEKNANFEILQVTIGMQFHWERKENQQFKGKLKLFARNGKLTVVNILSIEDYLLSVISSEMSATSSLELLKAHAVISRSWLLAQLCKTKQKATDYKSFIKIEDGYTRWYDREDHADFDVCADDHCQRYQGITKISCPQVVEALQATVGEVLTCENAICDTRFYKCCGGVTEKFENVWEPTPHRYLTKVEDSAAPSNLATDLSKEENARKWILAAPNSFCNTHDKTVLRQVLNDYDQETHDFYRWKQTISQVQMQALLRCKVGIEVGQVQDLVPVERGCSGRIVRLKIVGTEKSITIGKELEIRKALSETHLYSAAFVVDKIFAQGESSVPETFVLRGAGWGHGVGLCQIGAAIMSEKGYDYQAILAHYFPYTQLKKLQYEK